MKTVNIPTYLNIDLAFEMPSIGRRVGAYFIDWIIKLGYIYFLSIVATKSYTNGGLLVSLAIYSPFLFYSFLLEWLNKGQTIGKMFVGIRVVGMAGNTPSVGQCAIRWMFLLVDAYLFGLFVFVSSWFIAIFIFSPLIGFLFAVNTKNQQRLGDIAAQTYIVEAQGKEYTIYDTIYAYSTSAGNEYVPQYPEVIRLSDNDMTIIKNLLERAKHNTDYLLASKLTTHIKKVLNIETQENEYVFLKKLLQDYNYLSLKEK